MAKPPRSLAACSPRSIEYSVPFWHAPYQTCVVGPSDSHAGEAIEVDADTVVTEINNAWIVSGPTHTARFVEEEQILVRQFGPGFRCGPGRQVWFTQDSVRISLDIQPEYTTDVGPMPPDDSVPWRLRRFMRLGPIIDLFWCDSARKHLGT